MLEAIDKYKFGIIAALLTYLIIFMYTTIDTIEYAVPMEPFFNQTRIEDKEEILEITPEQIIVPEDFSTDDVKNMSQNAHDDRKASYENYSENRSSEQIAMDIKALEEQMKKEAGGSEQRAKLQKEIEQRKKEQAAAKNNEPTNAQSAVTAPNKYAGTTMVYWDLNGRKAHQNNDNNIKNPGYTCDRANGIVIVNVKTNNNGDVISAEYNKGSSNNATSCMIEQALKYARMSRFEYSTDSGKQSGYIKYTFIYK